MLRLIPSPFSDFLISIYNSYLYSFRKSGQYKSIRLKVGEYNHLSLEELEKIQNDRFVEFVNYSKVKSSYYKKTIGHLAVNSVSDIKILPFLEKVNIIDELENISTIREVDGVVSYTGGTTGASMKVLYRKSCMQERFAYLDHFRSQHGYELGKKVAWFSGKNLLNKSDVSKGRYYKDDYINNIRFFSTFDITKDSARFYIDALNNFNAEYLVGFPSSVFRICKFSEELGVKLNGKVKVFFPTAETVTQEHRDTIGRVLGCKLVDQYASSEGAPFIFECKAGNLHIDITSGVFEVLDSQGNDAEEGELVVTAFATKGTPLIRYRVGDRLSLSDKKSCMCGSHMPIAKRIEGRKDDFVISPTKGEVNLGNISNCTKGIEGILCFQIEQKDLENFLVLVVGSEDFTNVQKSALIRALQERLGDNLNINVQVVDNIPVEKSGKFRIIKRSKKLDSVSKGDSHG